MSEPAEHRPSLRELLSGLPRPVWVICGGVFLNKLGNFVNIFLLVYLTSKGYSTFLAGVALGAIGFGSFIGNAVGGTIADRIGRRFAIVVSMIGSSAFTLLLPVSPNPAGTVALAIVVGFFARLFNPAGGAVLVDSTPPGQLVSAFALYRLAINVAMAVGPMLGGFLIEVNYNLLFYGDAAASLAFGLLVFVLLPETRPQRSVETSSTQTQDGYRQVFSDRSMVLYVMAVIAATYVYVQTTSTLALHVRDVGLSSSFFGLLLGINALICVLVELPLVRWTSKRNPAPVLAFGFLLQSIGVGLTAGAHIPLALIGTVVIWSLAETIYSPVAQTYPGLLAPEHLRGRYQGAEGIAATLAQTVGPALGGFLYGANENLLWGVCGGLGVVAAGVILFCDDPRKCAADSSSVPALVQTDP